MRKASYCLTSLLTLIVFANYDGIDSCSKISEYCIYNILYKYVCDDIQPSERTLQRFIKKTRPIINELNNKVNEIVYKSGKTHYKYVAVDRTIIKAKNSNFNVLKKKTYKH